MVSAMLFLTSFFGVRVAATAAEASPPEQPRGSLVIDGLSDSDATAVEATYRHFSGAQVWRLPLPPETTTSLRVATPASVTCVDALPRRSLDLVGDCPIGVSLTRSTGPRSSGRARRRPARYRRTRSSAILN